MKKKAFDYEKLLLFLLCIGFSFLFYGKTIAVENVNYGVEQLHQYNHELFKQVYRIDGRRLFTALLC